MSKKTVTEILLLLAVVAICAAAVIFGNLKSAEKTSGKSLESGEKTAPEPDETRTTVILDPGHGGDWLGCVREGVNEKDLVLEIAFRVKTKLESAGIAVIMTREDDTALSLEHRCEIANESTAELFISIHANSFEDSSIGGFESYYYETSARGKELSDLAVQRAADAGIATRYSRAADYQVIRETKIPAILIETGYMTNPAELELLRSEAYQEKLAEVISNAAIEYLGVNENEKA